MGELLRLTNPGDARSALDAGDALPAEIDGFRNFYAETITSHNGRDTLTVLTSGINPIGEIRHNGLSVVPAICVRSSPHRASTESTPWQDRFDLDVGHISYSGDNKVDKGPPEQAPGNKALLAQFGLHWSPILEDRVRAAPHLFFVSRRTGTGISGSVVEFAGVGLIENAERVVQWDSARSESFVNYLFDIVAIDLSAENENFDWDWIRRRRDPNLDPKATTLKYAPASWRRWVQDGTPSLERIRRRVSRLQIVPTAEQKPPAGSRHESILKTVYQHYRGSEALFEGVADRVVERIVRDSGSDYRRGWITPGSGDQGIDFVGRVDVGDGFARTKLVMLGQAKCQTLNQPTSGRYVARIVARLRRGWIGAYVTTSYFSANTQREILEDRYPVMLVHGRQLAEVLDKMMFERGITKPDQVSDLLNEIDSSYEGRLSSRNAEQVLQVD